MTSPKKPSLDGRPDEAGGLSYPCGTPPEPGHGREIRPGVRWLRMHLPWALTHINLYALADDSGWAIVDTGAQTRETLASWTRALAAEDALAGRRITRVFVTHMHPDHAGMAGWLTRRFDARLWMTRLEYLTCRALVADTGREAPDDAIRFYRRAGWNDEALEHYRARFGSFGRVVYALPDSFRRLSDGDRIGIGAHEWRVIVGNGHSPEHACLYCEKQKLLISGDQVLPRISSNVSVFPTEPDADPLADWIASLAKLRAAVPDEVLVLPSHGEPFHGLHARLDRLAAGHEKALARLRRTLAEPRRAIDVFGALFARPIESPELLGMATGESLAHLNHLVARGEVVREPGADGAERYWLKAARM
ncbi:MAG: Hydroxyacylglutathione hydrolase [Burkholderiaceae bacterium]|nr:Hydroxyacylglutathione hydrolase [Burkholderiaceae bacterium]